MTPNGNLSASAARAAGVAEAIVSFVLYNTDPDEVRAAVRQVRDSDGTYPIVLIDNSSAPLDLTEFVADGVTIVRPGRNIGYGAGHNLALSTTLDDARYHFVLNTDITFAPTVLPALVRFMDARPDVGLAMPVVRYPDQSPQYLCRLLPRPVDVFARAFLPGRGWTKALTRRYEVRDWSYDEALSFPFLSGCFMTLRSAMLKEAGLFDERFFLFAEDLDLSRRLHRISQTVLCPTVSVTHEYRTQTSASLRRKWLLIRSFIKYFNKYGWFWDRERAAMNRNAQDRVARSMAA